MIQFFSKTRNLLLLAMLASAALVRAQVALPYLQQFDDISDFETFTVANENNDEDLWRYDDIEQAAKCERNYDADDWLITPIFELEEGKTYELSFKSYIEMFGSESLAVFLGTSKRVSSFTTNILQSPRSRPRSIPRCSRSRRAMTTASASTIARWATLTPTISSSMISPSARPSASRHPGP